MVNIVTLVKRDKAKARSCLKVILQRVWPMIAVASGKGCECPSPIAVQCTDSIHPAPTMDSDTEAVVSLNNSLKLLQKLKVSLYALFDSVGNGPSESQDNQSYLLGIQQLLINMDSAFSALEHSGSSLPSHNPAPSNSMSITLEPENDNFEVFHQLCNSFTWTRRMQEYSTHVHTALKDNQLKRAGPLTGYVAKKTKRTYPDVHSVPSQKVDEIIDKISHGLAQKAGSESASTTVSVARPFGASTVLIISIGRVMKAFVVLRGLIAERVVVRGYGESPSSGGGHGNDQVDIWTESKYIVFRLVTQSAQAALLHFYTPYQPEVALYLFVQWLVSYSTLFSGECTYCGHILKDNVPPTGRSYDKSSLRYHTQCASSQAR